VYCGARVFSGGLSPEIIVGLRRSLLHKKGEKIGPVRGIMSLGMGFVRQATQEIELVNVPRSLLESLNETIPGEPHVPLTVPENGNGIRALGGQRFAAGHRHALGA